jgi:hypothetical protein
MPHTLRLFPSFNTDLYLFLTETHGLLHRDSQLVRECIKVLIRRQIKPVKTIAEVSVRPLIRFFGKNILNLPRVSLWQVCNLPSFLNRKASRPITSLQIFETVHRNS